MFQGITELRLGSASLYSRIMQLKLIGGVTDVTDRGV